MPYLLALLAAAGGIIYWMYRARDAAQVTHEIADMASDVMGAARRFGFRRKYNTHPVDSIDEPDLAAGALGVAFLELSGMPTQDQKNALLISLQTHLNLSKSKAEELMVLGHWLVNECQGAAPAIPRLSKRLYKISGAQYLETTMGLVSNIVAAGTGELSQQQHEALHEVRRAFRVS